MGIVSRNGSRNGYRPSVRYSVPCSYNGYGAVDSNYSYKMIGIGKEVARVLMGEKSAVLHPFRFPRYAEEGLHPTSNSPSCGCDARRL